MNSDLPAGTRLLDYRIDRVLGHGGFGITYLATDLGFDTHVAIKEFLPGDMAIRVDALQVAARNRETKPTFDWGLARFLGEAQLLARFRHPNIVEVLRYFEANGTAYMVMAYVDGLDLFDVISRRGTLGERALRDVIVPLLDGLRAIHRAELLHRDIKPDNIFIRHDGSPVLLDFGAARQAFGRQSRALTTIVTPGYAPHEQYQSKGNQGPWSDIYALAGVLYTGISGELPTEAPARIAALLRGGVDPMRPACEIGAGRYTRAFLDAIDAGLAVREQDRPQDVDAWLAMFNAPAAAPATRVPSQAPALPARTTHAPAADATEPTPSNGATVFAHTPVPEFLGPGEAAKAGRAHSAANRPLLAWWQAIAATMVAAVAWGLAPWLSDIAPLDAGDWRFGAQVFAGFAALATALALRGLLGGPATLGIGVFASGWLLAAILRVLLLQAAPSLGLRLGAEMVGVAGAVMGLVGGLSMGLALRFWARPKLNWWAVASVALVHGILWALRQVWAFEARRAAATRGSLNDPSLLWIDMGSWLLTGLIGTAIVVLLWRRGDLRWRRADAAADTQPADTQPADTQPADTLAAAPKDVAAQAVPSAPAAH